MGSRINLDEEAIRGGVEHLKKLGSTLQGSRRLAMRTGLAAFSPVTGLAQAGVSHGNVVSVHQPEAIKALATHLIDTAVLAEANLNSVVGADGAFSRMVSQIGMDSHFGNNAAAVDTDMQLAKIQNPTTNPFMFGKAGRGVRSESPCPERPVRRHRPLARRHRVCRVAVHGGKHH